MERPIIAPMSFTVSGVASESSTARCCGPAGNAFGRPPQRPRARAAIDAAFAAMATDPAYQAEAQTITDAFAHADWEALRLAEGSTT